jgi:hypothetical protein
MTYANYYPTGQILQISSHPVNIEGTSSIEIDGLISDSTHYISNGVPVPFPPQPTPDYIFEWNTHTWTDPRTIEQVRLDQWEVIKASRSVTLTSPLITPYGTFDADPASQKNITDAIALMQVLEATGSPQTVEFTLADNTVVMLTTQQMIEVGVLLGTRTQGIYSTSRALREQLEYATTIQEVQSVVWPV